MGARSIASLLACALLAALVAACLLSIPWSFGKVADGGASATTPRYAAGHPSLARIGPSWLGHDESTAQRFSGDGVPKFAMGSDLLGRSVLIRCLAGGAISLLVGLVAAAVSVVVGTLYGSVAAFVGGATDAIMMRIVDVLYGLPYVLLVVLLAVAGDAILSEHVSRHRERADWIRDRVREVAPGTDSRQAAAKWLAENPELKSQFEVAPLAANPPRILGDRTRLIFDLSTLVVAIGGVSWLTMARVIRGQVLSLKTQPFMDAARTVGASRSRIFFRHLLPNLVGPIVVYATLTVPQAILQESFLSFLGIGVKPPLPSWGNLAAEGLGELNPYRSHWWLLLFPCMLLALTLIALNVVGEMVRERLDPRSRDR